MDGRERQTPDGEADDFSAEVSDLRPDGGGAVAPSRTRALFQPHTRRQRNTRLVASVCVAMLALVVIFAGIPALRNGALGLVPGLVQTPTATATLAQQQFYLLPNPPGVDVTLDGHLLTTLPLPDGNHPLRLALGSHVFAWRSHQFPFAPLTCRISVPHANGDTCPVVASGPSLPYLPGSIIGMHVSMSALAPGTPGASQLPAVIQAALDAQTFTTIVQPGERFLATGQTGPPTVASQPLRAIRRMQLVTQSGYAEPCDLAYPAIPCRFAGQDCSRLCTVAVPPPTVATAPGQWIAGAQVQTTWNYQTLDGKPIAQAVPEFLGIQLAILRITWDGASWHATLIAGHTPDFDPADDLACDPARFALSNTPSWSFMLTDPPPRATEKFASDANLADGCVAVLDHGGPAIFLERFGVLLTVNDAAVNPTDQLFAANAAEQQLAQRLMAQLSP